MEEDGNLLLTDAGREVAEKIFERHTLLTNLLIQLGVDQETASADACKLEHAISDTSFNAIKNYISSL
jgi:Mn-dependent DtxR family transcriptional regulator